MNDLVITKALKELEDWGIIIKERKPYKKSKNKKTTYTINQAIALFSHGFKDDAHTTHLFKISDIQDIKKQPLESIKILKDGTRVYGSNLSPFTSEELIEIAQKTREVNNKILTISYNNAKNRLKKFLENNKKQHAWINENYEDGLLSLLENKIGIKPKKLEHGFFSIDALVGQGRKHIGVPARSKKAKAFQKEYDEMNEELKMQIQEANADFLETVYEPTPSSAEILLVLRPLTYGGIAVSPNTPKELLEILKILNTWSQKPKRTNS
ncbi:MAG: hypothetical protein GOV15_03555 [Candidatus Diapherotrites archaeon]|nr:hypothetical protein [Candidatus Diapherotrites archaeon]